MRTVLAALAFFAASAIAQTPEDFIRQSVEGLQAQTAAHSGTWRLGEESNWNVDQDKAEIVFTFPDGMVARAPVQVIGTLNTESNSFLWGWDHPSIVPPLRKHAAAAREWGQKNNVDRFTTRLVASSEEEAWQFTAVAARIANANGAYRARAGAVLVFMTFGEVKLSTPR